MGSVNQITKQDIIGILLQIQKTIVSHKDLLGELDSKIGDGDHGVSMAKGFNRLGEKLAEQVNGDIGQILKFSGFELLKNIKGAAGAIFATFFMSQATYYEQNLKDKEALELTDLSEMINFAKDQVMDRGKAQPGDKTLVDVLVPASQSLLKSAADNQGLAEAFALASQAAKAGVEATKDMISKKGRSSNLGLRSQGWEDPGAMSTYLMFAAISEYLNFLDG
jgi:dihydroxyacetone kinase-like protein